MAGYNPPPKNNIPFSFGTGGYQQPDWDDIAFGFETGTTFSGTADLQAAINVMQHSPYKDEAYTFLKYCEQYIVGYSSAGVQIIKGKCHYGGIRDLSAYIFAESGEGFEDLPASINIVYERDLPAEIIGHLPRNLQASILGLTYKDLPAYINTIQPVDLGGYIKPWPQRDLGGDLHGWDTKDLQGIVNIVSRENLPATIGGHRPRNLGSLIKGWVREAYRDLGANIHGYKGEDLTAQIQGTEYKDLPAYLFAIAPVDLSAEIHGWDTKDLQGIINVAQYPYNLPASITGRPWLDRDLSASITSDLLPPNGNLSAYILGTKGKANLPASIVLNYARDLGAHIDTGNDIGNLSAQISPKMMRLTGVLSVVTMEHKDMSATISIPCFYSDYRVLEAYIRPVYQANLSASIQPQGWLGGIENLGAKWGYQGESVVQDKLPITLNFGAWDYRTEDKFAIMASVFRSGLSLGASITGTVTPSDLSAYINCVSLGPYEFDYWKFRERVQDRTYTQVAVDYEEVDISFRTIVRDYFYSSGSNVVAKTNKYEHFVTKVASYYSPAKARRLDRRLHKIKYLYDMRYFDSVDEAMKFAIWYVTEQPEKDLNAIITATGGFINLTSTIVGKDKISTDTDLLSTIEGQREHSYDVVVGYTDDGVGYLEF